MTVHSYALREVVSFPRPLEEGVLYVSERFAASAHKCACGCGNEVILALNPAQWRFVKHEDGKASLHPSINNLAFPCRSHYWVRRGQVDWYPRLTASAARRASERDRRVRDVYYRQLNAVASPDMPGEAAASDQGLEGVKNAPGGSKPLALRLWNWLKSSFKADASGP